MARLISIIFIILLASPAWAFPPLIAGKTAGGAAATCSYSTQQSQTTDNNSAALGITTAQTYLASKFTTSNPGYKLCRITVKLAKRNSPTGTLSAYLYSDSSGPSTLLATSTTTYDASALTDTSAVPGEDKAFEFAQYELAASTAYWIALKLTGTPDGTNFVDVDVNSSAGSGIYKSENGSTWLLLNSGRDFYYVTTN